MMKYILIISLFLLSFSCNNNQKTTTKKTLTKKEIQQTPLFAKNEFNIKGMTCEIGCARLIQSKLSKLDGVKDVKVIFKDSLGQIEYDKNKLSFNTIEKTVNNIADGTLYKITSNKEVKKFSK